ncbi:hypothetical protein ACFY1P_18360 [Streptomyces sp. NPDC001407]|uniref:hypothetical protein n=1 Tax=unclassified Streptomyces TaxID=2593676 RepID=UPI00340C3A88
MTDRERDPRYVDDMTEETLGAKEQERQERQHQQERQRGRQEEAGSRAARDDADDDR